MSDRDTKFAGFADALYSEMCAYLADATVAGADDGNSAPYVQIIARRAYDLAQHTIGYSLEYVHECGHTMPGSMGKRILPSIPDLTTWPEDEK